MADHNALTEEKRAIKLNFKAKVKDMQKRMPRFQDRATQHPSVSPIFYHKCQALFDKVHGWLPEGDDNNVQIECYAIPTSDTIWETLLEVEELLGMLRDAQVPVEERESSDNLSIVKKEEA